MTFSTDRDLLLIEPHVFRDVPLMSQQLLEITDASITGTTLASATADFAAAQLDVGSVVLIQDSDTACEVIEVVNANTLSVSLPRADPNTAAIPVGDGSGLTVVARTFAPQAAMAHGLLLRLTGMDHDVEEEITAESIVSTSVMAHLEALGTLELVYAAASTLTGDNDEVTAKATQYRQRFNQAFREARVLIDVDGDGVVDEERNFGLINLHRV